MTRLKLTIVLSNSNAFTLVPAIPSVSEDALMLMVSSPVAQKIVKYCSVTPGAKNSDVALTVISLRAGFVARVIVTSRSSSGDYSEYTRTGSDFDPVGIASIGPT